MKITFNTSGMRNADLKVMADEWVGGRRSATSARLKVLKTFKYDVVSAQRGGNKGVVGLKDLVFLASIANGESMDRAVHVFPVICSGTLYELHVILDGTGPKGYAVLHLEMAGEDHVGAVKVGWRDIQFPQVLGSFIFHPELFGLVAGIYFENVDGYGEFGEMFTKWSFKKKSRIGVSMSGLPIIRGLDHPVRERLELRRNDRLCRGERMMSIFDGRKFHGVS